MRKEPGDEASPSSPTMQVKVPNYPVLALLLEQLLRSLPVEQGAPEESQQLSPSTEAGDRQPAEPDGGIRVTLH